MTSVAFIGLGNMGLGMAQRMLKASHDLRVYNRTGSKARRRAARPVVRGSGVRR